MKFDDFIAEIKRRYPDCGNTEGITLAVDEALHLEGDGDMVYENKDYVICKYVHTLRLYKVESGEPLTVRFCAYGVGGKLYTDIDDYELTDYTCFDFLPDW